MLYEIECHSHVVVPGKSVVKNNRISGHMIMKTLLQYLLKAKATGEYGYFLAVTALHSIGKGHMNACGCVLFPVSFSCRMFKPKAGEILVGVVYVVHHLGVFMRCGPMDYVYLSVQKMPNYHYQLGETGNKAFLSSDGSRIQKDVAIRFSVLAVRWSQIKGGEFAVLASLDGDGLGPISSAGNDGLESYSV